MRLDYGAHRLAPLMDENPGDGGPDSRRHAVESIERLRRSMLEIVETFTHEAEFAGALLAVLRNETELGPIVEGFDLSGERDRLTGSLDRFETDRRNSRIAVWRVLQAEGRSIGEISRMFGVSRQLVSRQLLASERANGR